MKIPFPDSQLQTTRPLAEAPAPVLDNGESARILQQATDRLANSAGEQGDSIATHAKNVAEKAKAEAEAIAQTNATTQYLQLDTEALEGSKDTPGFLETRGLDASASSSEVLAGLEKGRQKIAADSFADPVAKAKWLASSGELYAASTRKVESHASQQRIVAGDDALKGGLDTLQQAIANDTTGKDTQQLADHGERMIRSLQRSQAGGDASVLKWRSDVATTRINSLLSTANSIEDPDAKAKYINTAQKQFDEAKDFIVKPENVKFEIDKAQAVLAKATLDRTAEHRATTVVQGSTGLDGRVDVAKVESQVLETPAGPLRDEVRTRAQQQAQLQTAAFKEQTDIVSKKAFSAFNTGGWAGIPAALKVDLNNRNPELYDKLQTEAQRKWKAAQGSGAEQRREQAAINKEALNDFMSLPTADRAKQDMDLFLADHPGVDAVGRSALGPKQRGAVEVLTKAGAEKEGEFVRQAAALRPAIPIKKKGDAQKDAAAAREWKARATSAYQAFVLKHGEAPTDEDAAKLSTALVLFGPGSGSNQPEPDAYAAAIAPPAKTSVKSPPKAVVKWKVSPDKKQRAPVYSDGTVGAIEEVP